MYELRQNKKEARGKVSRQIDAVEVKQRVNIGNVLQRNIIQFGNKKKSPPPQVPPSSISKGNRGALQKGNGPADANKWILEDTEPPITGAHHHIINFNTGLKGWFDNMVASYNGVLSVGSQNGSLQNPANNIKGKIKRVLQQLGVKFDGDNIPNIQQEFSWRRGNLFLGVNPDHRDDDPGTKNEFGNSNPSERGLRDQFTQNELLFNEMKQIRINTDIALQKPNDSDIIDGISFSSPMPNNAIYDTDHTHNDNIHWEIKSGSEWGATGKIYRLKK